MALIKTNARSSSQLDATILTGNLPAINGSALTNISAGKVGQVVSASKQTVASFSSSSTNTFVDLAGLTLNITPSATSSKILILSTACIAESTSATIHVRLLRDSTVINGGDPQSSQLDSMNSVRYQSATPYGQALYDVSQNFLDSPNTTSQITYKLQGTLGSSYSGTYYLNRSDSDSDADFGARTPSNLTAMEILA
mgnify:CR=1 FL=1|tara:strand:+ start:316 stop:906 length:591 start_codon:yes stop_codon:yes gene_type:complete